MKIFIINILFLCCCVACVPSSQRELYLFNKHYKGTPIKGLIPVVSLEKNNPDLTYIVYIKIPTDSLNEMITKCSFYKIQNTTDVTIRHALKQLCEKYPEIKGDFRKAIYESTIQGPIYTLYLLTDENNPDYAIFIKFGI